MQILTHRMLVNGVVWLLGTLSLSATPQALIVVGSSGSQTITSSLTGVAKSIHDGLIQRGFSGGNVQVLQADPAGEPVTAQKVLAVLKKQQGLSATDEFCLVLLGFGGRDDESGSTFQVTGPRLTAGALKTALNAIPANQFVFVGTSDSGGFIKVLLARNREVLAATSEEGEIDLPRFPEAWAAALTENPAADWKQIAARAAVLTDKAYADSNLAMGEHARLGDNESGRVLEAPFGADTLAKVALKSQPDGSMASVNAADIKVEIHKPNSEWEKQPATAETKKLIETARNTPNPDGFSAIMLQQKLGYKVGDDRMAEEFTMQRVYLAREDSVEKWANYLLPQNPPAITTKLVAARIIQPDGSATVLNPEKMPAASDCSSGMCGALTTVFMPDAHAGCLIEIAYRSRHILDASIPDFSESLEVQRDIPVLLTELQFQLPEKSALHYKLRNSDQKPEVAHAGGMQQVTWKFGSLPAYESLPHDPPARDFVISLDVSSLQSWDAFETWYRRLTHGSDAQDPAVKAKAEELAATARDRTGKIRRAFEFVSALRYVAIEFGVNGIVPRTPALVLQNRYGDCKDKANLLVALLSDMGIEAQFCVLNRFSSTDASFPSWRFNHAIAYVPKAPDVGQPDDLWLDTTDSTAPFPTLPPGDVGRAALVFAKDSAKFLTVKGPEKEATVIDERWKLAESGDAPGRFDGTLQMQWTGLAEYEMRRVVRGLSPRQRDYILQEQFMQKLPQANLSKVSLTPADDLSQPMKMDAQINVDGGPRPRPAFDLAGYFAAPQRDRPLLVNNGQKFRLTQTLEVTARNTAQLPSAFDQKAAGVHASITWQANGSQGWTRKAELSVEQPEIAAADYTAVRTMLRDWMQRLTL